MKMIEEKIKTIEEFRDIKFEKTLDENWIKPNENTKGYLTPTALSMCHFIGTRYQADMLHELKKFSEGYRTKPTMTEKQQKYYFSAGSQYEEILMSDKYSFYDKQVKIKGMITKDIGISGYADGVMDDPMGGKTLLEVKAQALHPMIVDKEGKETFFYKKKLSKDEPTQLAESTLRKYTQVVAYNEFQIEAVYQVAGYLLLDKEIESATMNIGVMRTNDKEPTRVVKRVDMITKEEIEETVPNFVICDKYPPIEVTKERSYFQPYMDKIMTAIKLLESMDDSKKQKHPILLAFKLEEKTITDRIKGDLDRIKKIKENVSTYVKNFGKSDSDDFIKITENESNIIESDKSKIPDDLLDMIVWEDPIININKDLTPKDVLKKITTKVKSGKFTVTLKK